MSTLEDLYIITEYIIIYAFLSEENSLQRILKIYQQCEVIRFFSLLPLEIYNLVRESHYNSCLSIF